MAVYLDLVMALNFGVDFLLLLGTNRLSGYPARPWRCAGAALLGAAYAAGCLLPGFRFLRNLLWRGVSLALMAVLAFGWEKSALKRGAVFVLLSMALGGLALSMGRNDIPALLLAAGGCCLLCRLSFGDKIGGKEYVQVVLRYQGREERITALRDTGNALRDPITGESVLVVAGDIGERLTGLTGEQLRQPLKTLTNPPIKGLRLIPYRAVGNAGGMLLGLRIQDAQIGTKQSSVIVAFAPEGLGDSVQALTGGAI